MKNKSKTEYKKDIMKNKNVEAVIIVGGVMIPLTLILLLIFPSLSFLTAIIIALSVLSGIVALYHTLTTLILPFFK